VEEEPAIKLYQWQVFSVPGLEGEEREHHFWGRYAGAGRVSSRIVSFDSESCTGTTRSGRQYKLVGPPGLNMDALYVWDRWAEIHRIRPEDVVNVTEDYEGEPL
jgi:hypothetical protein